MSRHVDGRCSAEFSHCRRAGRSRACVPPSDPRDRGGPAQPLLAGREACANTSRSRGGLLNRAYRRGEGGRRRFLRSRQRRDAGHRRRIRLRQIHAGAAAHASASRPTAASIVFDGDPVGGPHGMPVRDVAPPCADGVPGQLCLAQSAPADRGIDRFGPLVHGTRARAAREHARETCCARSASTRSCSAALSARAVGRTEAARQHRPRAGARAAHGDPRRSRSRRSTNRSRRRCSTCCASSRRSST